MRKFEYKVATVPTSATITNRQYVQVANEIEDALNELGNDGWELVQRADGFFFFKREIQGAQ